MYIQAKINVNFLLKIIYSDIIKSINLKGCEIMCDIEKYKLLYEQIKELQPEDTLQLVLDSDTEEESEFYELVGDFLLQKRQKEIIEENKF